MFDRVREIIQLALAKRGITRYQFISLESEGLHLPGGAFNEEIVAHSGIVVTPEHAYYFFLDWRDHQYTIGRDEDWRELTSEDTTEYNWQRILQLQQQMRDDPTFGRHKPILPLMREPGKPTERERTIIWWWLASSRFFATYDLAEYDGPLFETFELLDVQSGGYDLIGSLLPGEVQDIAGILVLAEGAFHFRLSWIWLEWTEPYQYDPGQYSLGEKDGSWRPVLREECSEEQWRRIEIVQQRLVETLVRIPRLEHPIWTGPDDAVVPPDDRRVLLEEPELPVRPRKKRDGERRPRQPRKLRERGERIIPPRQSQGDTGNSSEQNGQS